MSEYVGDVSYVLSPAGKVTGHDIERIWWQGTTLNSEFNEIERCVELFVHSYLICCERI